MCADAVETGADAGEESPDHVSLADGVEAIHEREWPRLQLEQRAFLFAAFRAFARGKREMVESLEKLDSRAVEPAGTDRGQPPISLDQARQTQRRHAAFFDILSEKVESGDVREVGSSARPDFESVFAPVLPESVDSLRRSPSVDARAAAIAVYRTMILGVLADTAYDGLLTLFDRYDFSAAARAPLERLRRQDRRQGRAGDDLIAALLRRSSSARAAVSEALDQTFLPTIEIFRGFQNEFDYIQLGLLPDELVSHAIERFCTFYDRLYDIDSGPTDSTSSTFAEEFR